MPAPNITAMSVHEGPTTGGTTVVITGTDLDSTTALWYFDAGITAVSSYVIDSPTQITATMPAHAKSVGAIYADWSGGSSTLVDADRYTYDNSSTDPRITSVVPDNGTGDGGTVVTITGKNFQVNGVDIFRDVDTVQFGFYDAASFTVDSDTQITAVTPAHFAAGTYVIAYHNSPSFESSPVGFETVFIFTAPPALPVITSIEPSRGVTAGGDTVEINGNNLTDVTDVTVDGVSIYPDYTVIDDGRVEIITPTHAAGTVSIEVFNGGDSDGGDFTYTNVPAIDIVVNGSGSQAGGVVETIYGSVFNDVTDVTFDGISAAFTIVSTTIITVTTPAHAGGFVDVLVTSPGGTSNAWPYSYEIPGPVGGTLDDACPLLTIYNNVAMAVLVADGVTLDEDGVIWALTKLDGWWDGTELATGTEEIWPQGEVFASSRENARKIDIELLGTIPGIPLGTLAGDAIGNAKAAFACVQVPFQIVIDDGGALGPLSARVRRLDPVRVEILGARYAVKVAATLTAADPRRYDAGDTGHA